MANYLDDILDAQNGKGDTVIDLSKLGSGTTWQFRKAASGTPRTVTYSGYTRPATQGPYGGDLVIVGKPGQTVLDCGGNIINFASANSLRLTLADIAVGNGTLSFNQPDTKQWYQDISFTQGDWGASALFTKGATAHVDAGSNVVTITSPAGSGDRFTASDPYVPTGAGRSSADKTHGFLMVEGGGNYTGLAAGGYLFGYIAKYISATKIQLSQNAAHTGTFPIRWGPFPSTNLIGPRGLFLTSSNCKRNRLYGCDMHNVGDGVKTQHTTDLVVQGFHLYAIENDTNLDPPDIDSYHNDAVDIFIEGIRAQFLDSEIEGRVILQDAASGGGGAIDATFARVWNHGNLVVFQATHNASGFTGGLGVKVALDHSQIWNDKGDGVQSTLPHPFVSGGGVTVASTATIIDKAPTVAPGTVRTAPQATWRNAHPDASWPQFLYGQGGTTGGGTPPPLFASVVGSTSNANASSNLVLNVPSRQPDGTPYTPQQGDVYVAFIADTNPLGPSGINDPPGWTLVDTDDQSAAVTIRTAVHAWMPGDPAQFEWIATAGTMVGGLLAIRNADVNTIIENVAHWLSNTAVTTATIPALGGTASDYDLHVVAVVADNTVGGVNMTGLDGNYTQAFRVFSSSQAQPTLMVAYRETIPPGDPPQLQMTLAPGAKYETQALAVKNTPTAVQPGTGASDFVVGIPIAPAGTVAASSTPDPVIFGASAGDATVSIIWTPPAQGPILGYEVEFTPAPPGGQPPANGGIPETAGGSHGGTFGPLNNGTTYSVRIRATNAAGVGAWSTVASGLTPQPAKGVTLAQSNGLSWGTLTNFDQTKRRAVIARMCKADKTAAWGRYDWFPSSGTAPLFAAVDEHVDNGCFNVLVILNGTNGAWGNVSDGSFPTTANATAFGNQFQTWASQLRSHLLVKYPNNKITIAYECANEAQNTVRDSAGRFVLGKYLYAYSLMKPKLKAGDSSCLVGPTSTLHDYTRLPAGAPGSNFYGSPIVAADDQHRTWCGTDLYVDMSTAGGAILSYLTGSIGAAPTIVATGFDMLIVHPYCAEIGPLGLGNGVGAKNNQTVVNGMREVKYLADAVYNACIAAGYATALAKQVCRVWATEIGFPTAPPWVLGATYAVGQVVNWPIPSENLYTCNAPHTASSANAPGTGSQWTAGVSGTWNRGEVGLVHSENLAGQYGLQARQVFFGLIADADGVWLAGPKATRTRTGVYFDFQPMDEAGTGVGTYVFGAMVDATKDKGTPISQGQYGRWKAIAQTADTRT